MKPKISTMEQILLYRQDPAAISSFSSSFSDIVSANMQKYQRSNSSGPTKRVSEDRVENLITPVVLENFRTPSNSLASNQSIIREIQKYKPHVQLLKMVHMRNGNILIFPKDTSSQASLLSPWPEGAFNRAQFSCRLARRHGPVPPPEVPTKFLVIKGINTNITEDQVKEELVKKGVKVLRIQRIISKSTHQPTTFMKIHLTEPDQAEMLLREGFSMDLFQYKVGKQRSPPTIKQCYKCQQFNHISTNCTNPIVCLRCAESHHHKTCTKEKGEAKCANCAGKHSATSKSCPVFLSHKAALAKRIISGRPAPDNPSKGLKLKTEVLSDAANLCNDLKQLALEDEKIEEVLKILKKYEHPCV